MTKQCSFILARQAIIIQTFIDSSSTNQQSLSVHYLKKNTMR